MQKLFILTVLFLGSAFILPLQAQNTKAGVNGEGRTTAELMAHQKAQIERAVANGSVTLERLQVAVAEKDIASASVLHQDMLECMKAEVERRSAQL
ncbi:MAG: hypothetical protein AAGH79_13480, partial [Bacteroidota bacterium]